MRSRRSEVTDVACASSSLPPFVFFFQSASSVSFCQLKLATLVLAQFLSSSSSSSHCSHA